jgi:hypothetical protein
VLPLRKTALRFSTDAKASSEMNYASGAVEHSGLLYITGRGMDRLAVLPDRHLPK